MTVEAVALAACSAHHIVILAQLGPQSANVNIYGAGIISSFGESKHIFESTIQCDAFDIDQILETDFDKSSIQQRYYEISSMEEMQRGLDRLEEIAKGRNRIKKAS